MTTTKRELKILSIVFIVTIMLLLLHEFILLCINIHVTTMPTEMQAETMLKDWYINFMTYYVNYNSCKMILYVVPILLLILNMYKLYVVDKQESHEAQEPEPAATSATVDDNIDDTVAPLKYGNTDNR